MNERKKFQLGLKGIFLIVSLNFGLRPWFQLSFNATESLEGYIYLVFKNKTPKKGELMAFYPPPNRFYRQGWFVKYALAVSGDNVTRKENDFFINGNYIGTAKQKTKKGELLLPAREGLIPSGKFFAWTRHQDSFDSRYHEIGLVDESQIIGRAIRLL